MEAAFVSGASLTDAADLALCGKHLLRRDQEAPQSLPADLKGGSKQIWEVGFDNTMTSTRMSPDHPIPPFGSSACGATRPDMKKGRRIAPPALILLA